MRLSPGEDAVYLWGWVPCTQTGNKVAEARFHGGGTRTVGVPKKKRKDVVQAGFLEEGC